MKHILTLVIVLVVVAVGGVVVAQSMDTEQSPNERQDQVVNEPDAPNERATTAPADAEPAADSNATGTANGSETAAPCQADIAKMQEVVEQQDQMCTMQVAEMQCPHDSSVTHTARDGCQIQALRERGWSRAAPEQQ